MQVESSVLQICKQFTHVNVEKITTLGNGLINNTYRVKTDIDEFVLQQVNAEVFKAPHLIMENLIVLNQHISQKSNTKINLKLPAVIPTIHQDYYCIDDKNNFWRAFEFINNTESRESISYRYEAEQIGIALATFHCLLSDAPITSFHDTLPGFHITPAYFQKLQHIEKNLISLPKNKKVENCKNFINKFQPKINVLESAKQKGQLTERVIHGDPKLNNFLFDIQSDRIISLIDLDTVKPGLVHYDIADCLRSCCHNTPSNTFDVSLCAVILKSYLQQACVFFSKQDYEYLFPAIQLIPFELGLRFFIDYLEGNRYFKVDSSEQNLYRALTQFKLCESIEAQEAEIKQIISDCRKRMLAGQIF